MVTGVRNDGQAGRGRLREGVEAGMTKHVGWVLGGWE
jgi:hypothetical protein